LTDFAANEAFVLDATKTGGDITVKHKLGPLEFDVGGSCKVNNTITAAFACRLPLVGWRAAALLQSSS
jgi:hypothetical protein